MKHFALLIGGAAALVGCAPGVTGPVTGRIVNISTGQEGTVSFTRGTLKPRLDGPKAAENAVVSIGGQTFRGRTVIINSGVTALPTWNVGFDWFAGSRAGNSVGWYSHFTSPRNEVLVSRAGNLIARTDSSPSQTLTCTLHVDEFEHGVGDCLDSSGTKYALQF